MRIVLFASGDFAIPTLQSLTEPGHEKHEVVCLVTQPDRGAGRGRKEKPTPAGAEGLRLGLEIVATDRVNAPETIQHLGRFEADLGLVIAFGQKIGGEVRRLFPHQCVNLHASLLPRYRGAAPIQWAIINGEKRTGVSVFRLVDRLDAGPVYVQRWTHIKPEERACELHHRLARVGVDAVSATLEILEHEPAFEPQPQDDSAATRAPKLSKEEGYVRFDVAASELAHRVCGLWNWPGAKCAFVSSASGRTERVTLALARLGDTGSAAEEPGVLDYRRYVATAEGYLEILEIKPDGARLMTFQDFVNGRHVSPGDRFAPICIDGPRS